MQALCPFAVFEPMSHVLSIPLFDRPRTGSRGILILDARWHQIQNLGLARRFIAHVRMFCHPPLFVRQTASSSGHNACVLIIRRHEYIHYRTPKPSGYVETHVSSTAIAHGRLRAWHLFYDLNLHGARLVRKALARATRIRS